jgi:hypothetical protein
MFTFGWDMTGESTGTKLPMIPLDVSEALCDLELEFVDREGLKILEEFARGTSGVRHS